MWVYWISYTVHAHTQPFYTLKWNLLSLWFILPSCIFMYGFFSSLARYFISIVSSLRVSLSLSLPPTRFSLCYVSHFVLSVSIRLVLFSPFHIVSQRARSLILSLCAMCVCPSHFLSSIRSRCSNNSTSSIARYMKLMSVWSIKFYIFWCDFTLNVTISMIA